jgi:HEAT repeat protein
LKAKLAWYKTLSTEDREKFKTQLFGSQEVLDRLIEILQDKYDESLSLSESKDRYGEPNWALEQADHIGQRRVIQNIIELVTLTED